MSSHAAPILIAVGDPVLHPEATHLAAATGRQIIDTVDPAAIARHHARAFAVLIDDEHLPDIASLPPRPGVFHIRSDTTITADDDLADSTAPQGTSASFILPAEAAALLKAMGKLALGGAGGKKSSRLHASRGVVLCFIGAAGGAGTSTVAAAVAQTAAEESEPVLVDAHRYSGGLDLLLGVEETPGARWGDIDIGEGSVDRGQVRQALPAADSGVAVLTGARSAVAVPGFSPGELDRVVTVLGTGGLTVVDAPPDGLPNRCDYAFIVTPAEVRGAAAAALIAAQCRAANTPAGIVVRHRGWSGLTAEEMAHVAKTDVVAEVKHMPKLVRATEVAGLPGRLPRPLATAARSILAVVG